MQLPGNLQATTLGDLLGTLHRAGASGTLELVEDRGATAGRTHRVHLSRGLVERVETRLPVMRLGEILLSEGLVSRQLLERVVMRASGRSVARFGQLLLNERAVTGELLAAALRYQLRRKLDSLFALEEARIRFRVPRPIPGSERSIPLSPREFLHGRPRSRARTARPRRAVDGMRAASLRTLGLGPDASPQEAHRAFRALALRHHPDRFPDLEAPRKRELIERFAELSAAYHALTR
jgi:DnaJ-domain-containing protein 1